MSNWAPDPPPHDPRFFSPFESGYRPYSGWRWYWRFLREYPGMVLRVEHDCFAALEGLVIA